MADATRQIIFHESMGIDKRDPEKAYLRRNIFKARTRGLYPSRDFHQENPDNLDADQDIVDIIGTEEGTFDIKVIIQDGDDVRFRNLGSNSESNTTLTNVDFECGIAGDDGVYIACDDDDVYKVQHVNSNTSSEGTFTDATPSLAGFDGLYYWWLSSNEIYKQLSSNAPTVAFNNLGVSPDFVGFYGDQMVIFAQEGNDIVILFWDKSDTDLFDQRILVRNARLIAGGVVDGRLMMVKSVGNSSNPKEQDGEIVVTAYDGQKFVRENSIKAGDDEVSFEDITGVGVGSEVMAFSVTNNEDSHNEDLYQDYIYKIHGDGSIEVVDLPDTATYADVHIVRIFYNFICYAHRGFGAQEATIWINEENSNDYGSYEGEFSSSVYITEFLNNVYNRHSLAGIAVTFEKIFEQTDEGADPETGESLEIYYRVSERDDWTLIDTITAEKVANEVNTRRDQSTEYASDSTGLPQQRFDITKMSDGESALPEFNEIQFKFVPLRGFSIIDAIYSYDYISRTTMN